MTQVEDENGFSFDSRSLPCTEQTLVIRSVTVSVLISGPGVHGSDIFFTVLENR